MLFHISLIIRFPNGLNKSIFRAIFPETVYALNKICVFSKNLPLSRAFSVENSKKGGLLHTEKRTLCYSVQQH